MVSRMLEVTADGHIRAENCPFRHVLARKLRAARATSYATGAQFASALSMGISDAVFPFGTLCR
jgi:hypothetical protein